MTEIFCRQLAEFFFSGTVRVCFLFFCFFFQTLLHRHLLGTWAFLPKLTQSTCLFSSQSLLSLIFVCCISNMPNVPCLSTACALWCLAWGMRVCCPCQSWFLFFCSGVKRSTGSPSWLIWNALRGMNQTVLCYRNSCLEPLLWRLGIPWGFGVHVE